MKVVFFAQSRQATRCDESLVKTESPMTIAELWDRLVVDFPDLAPLRKSARLARRETYLNDDDLLQPQDEIAVIPPVSGG